jgi:hypothetical protein
MGSFGVNRGRTVTVWERSDRWLKEFHPFGREPGVEDLAELCVPWRVNLQGNERPVVLRTPEVSAEEYSCGSCKTLFISSHVLTRMPTTWRRMTGDVSATVLYVG